MTALNDNTTCPYRSPHRTMGAAAISSVEAPSPSCSCWSLWAPETYMVRVHCYFTLRAPTSSGCWEISSFTTLWGWEGGGEEMKGLRWQRKRRKVGCHEYLPYSRKLSREKTFVNFTVLWLFAKVFSTKFGDVATFGAAQVSNPHKFFFLRKL